MHQIYKTKSIVIFIVIPIGYYCLDSRIANPSLRVFMFKLVFLYNMKLWAVKMFSSYYSWTIKERKEKFLQFDFWIYGAGVKKFVVTYLLLTFFFPKPKMEEKKKKTSFSYMKSVLISIWNFKVTFIGYPTTTFLE